MPRQVGLNRVVAGGHSRAVKPLTSVCVLAMVAAALLPAGCAAQSRPAVEISGPEAMPSSRSLPAEPVRFGRIDVPPGARVTAEKIAEAVRADAARVLNVTDAELLSVAVTAVTWNDGSLGCPQPGVMYTQALVPGWRIVVGNGSREWLYHASSAGAWVQCPASRAHAPPPGSSLR